MYIDSALQFSDAQTFAAGGGVGDNVIDLGSDRSIGNGEPMAVMFVVEVAADQTSGDEDYTFDVEYASNAAQSAGVQLIGRRVFESGTPTAPAQDADLLVAGFRFYIPLPPVTAAEDEQFIGIRYVTAGSTPIITCSAHLIPLSFADSYVDYANNYTIV